MRAFQLLISGRPVTEAFSAFLRRPGLRASNGGVLASGDITRTQNVSEYMLVLALCLVVFIDALAKLLEAEGIETNFFG